MWKARTNPNSKPITVNMDSRWIPKHCVAAVDKTCLHILKIYTVAECFCFASVSIFHHKQKMSAVWLPHSILYYIDKKIALKMQALKIRDCTSRNMKIRDNVCQSDFLIPNIYYMQAVAFDTFCITKVVIIDRNLTWLILTHPSFPEFSQVD